MLKTNSNYNPDVLSCLANLSNDEVFTPPNLVNDILNLLPDKLWSDANAKFLDPVSKSGVFLREIAKRLMKGLEGKMSMFGGGEKGVKKSNDDDDGNSKLKNWAHEAGDAQTASKPYNHF